MNTKKYIKFESAREYVQKLGLKNFKEWKRYAQTNRPDFIPSNPNNYYGDKYKGIHDWIGYKAIKKKSYSLNEDFFKVWSREMAYILGFWWADGSISVYKNNYRFSISQKDKEILEDIKSHMSYSGKELYENNGSYHFIIASRNVVQDIMSIGGVPKKSSICIFPSVPSQFVADFCRGYFDGDGSIWFSKNNNLYQSKITCGSKNFIYRMHEILKEYINDLQGSIEIVNPSSLYPRLKNTLYNLRFGCFDTAKLYDFFYKDNPSLYLKRKRVLLENCIKTNPKKINHYRYQELKALIKEHGIRYMRDLKAHRNKFKDYRIPSAIETFYTEYKYYDLFEPFATYEKANHFAISLGLKSVAEWQLWAKSKQRPSYIHSNPQKYYKGKGWVNWKVFLGN